MLQHTTARKLSWQAELSNMVTDPAELLALLRLDPALLPAARLAAKLFPLKAPHAYIRRMQHGDPLDPLLLQVLPLSAELTPTSGYTEDPLKEIQANPIPGLLHKYEDRVLVTLTSACAVHCRYCFRRHFPYADNIPGKKGWEKLLAYINAHVEINEVILSGGDPLAVSDHLLEQFAAKLAAIKHIKRLRIHTRLPIVLPSRITFRLTAWLAALPMQAIMVVHANHPQEIDDNVRSALARLRAANVTLLNQSVLLRGINDDETVLATLSERLFAAGVLPYYLHLLDKVQGAAHFDLPFEHATAIYRKLQGRLSGYLVPKLVKEVPGATSKSLAQ